MLVGLIADSAQRASAWTLLATRQFVYKETDYGIQNVGVTSHRGHAFSRVYESRIINRITNTADTTAIR